MTGLKKYTSLKVKASDIVVLPGYDLRRLPPVDDHQLFDWLRKADRTGEIICSICTGAFTLAAAGLLDNLTSTTFHASIESLQKALPATKALSNVRFVDNGKVITTADISAGIDGALHLVAKLKGDEMAREVAKYMEYDKWVPE